MKFGQFAIVGLLLASCSSDDDGLQVPPLGNANVSDASTAIGDSAAPSGEPDAAPSSCPRVRVTAAQTLNVRAAPSTTSAEVGKLNSGQVASMLQEVSGEVVSGNNKWFEIMAGSLRGFVSAAFAACTQEAARLFPATAFLLPIECLRTVRIAQGNNGSFSHTGRTQFAYDFSVPLNTPLLAMQDGVVLGIHDATKPGDPCYNGGDSSCFPAANYVLLQHGDGNTSIYKHLNRVDVKVGDLIARGTTVGLSGSTGYSTGPHAHVMRQVVCDTANCQSIPLVFADVPGNGVPATNDMVTSQNCK